MHRHEWLVALALGLPLIAAAGCGSSSKPNDPGGSSGNAGRGGSGGSGGGGGNAGQSGSAGASAAGGKGGSAGSSPQAGEAGTSGNAGDAGHAGETGRAGDGGASGDMSAGGYAGSLGDSGASGDAGAFNQAGAAGASSDEPVPVLFRFMNSVINHDGPVYVCGYPVDGPNWLGPDPLWSASFPDGIPHGAVTDYEPLPHAPSGATEFILLAILSATSPGCPADLETAQDDPRLLFLSAANVPLSTHSNGFRHVFMQAGGYATADAATSFDVCGPNRDAPCDDTTGPFLSWLAEDDATPAAGTARVFVPLPSAVESLRLCFAPDTGDPISLTIPVENYPPFGTGVVYVISDSDPLGCEGEHLASLQLPAPPPFGTDDAPGTFSTIDAGDSVAFIISGAAGDVPAYAALSIVPLRFASR